MIKPATTSEYVTMAVPIVVAGVPKLEMIPSTETCKEETLKTISICAKPMMTIGNHEVDVSALV
jgi:hypothetical protein